VKGRSACVGRESDDKFGPTNYAGYNKQLDSKVTHLLLEAEDETEAAEGGGSARDSTPGGRFCPLTDQLGRARGE
jgi:hypothetical protein